jgi:HPt (histidine-containing phosphotransfer) domain-containing protein
MIGISTGPSKVSPPSPLPGDAPIDLDHLSRMTLGERGLELFERQAKMLLARMRSAALPVVAAQAHTLKGSARSIGAWRVARAAETVEQASSDEIAAALAALDAAVAEARAAIAGLLRSH